MPKYSLSPRYINSDTWYYETKKGIEVIHRFHDATGNYYATETMILRWRMVAMSLARHRRKP